LYPLSIVEINQKYNILQIQSKIQDIMKYWLYPWVFDYNIVESKETLKSIVSNYLYKDILEFAWIRKSEFIINILQMLALQVWSEVSYTELANSLNINTVTVQNYIDLLEKSFVIYKVKGFSRNLRNEITKTVKIYFWDIWILNSLLNNFNDFELRTDKWWLWENFCITERLKHLKNSRILVNYYFWRTYWQQEIDYLEEKDGKLYAFEFKLNSNKKAKIPKSFQESYPNSEFQIINRENFLNFVS
jgi:predicted AAA+ superfamily ATPase